MKWDKEAEIHNKYQNREIKNLKSMHFINANEAKLLL